MAKNTARQREASLAERLKAEAGASRPEFSQSLHERICKAALRSETRATPLPKAMRLGRRRVHAVVAATTIVILTVAAWWATHPQQPGLDPDVQKIVVKQPQQPESPLDAVDPLRGLNNLVGVPGDLDSLVASTITAQRWAYLDEDARTAARLLIDQLPQLESPN